MSHECALVIRECEEVIRERTCVQMLEQYCDDSSNGDQSTIVIHECEVVIHECEMVILECAVLIMLVQ